MSTPFDRWFVPILVVAIAANQMYLAHTRDLSPWKGGGFGMFGSSDHPSHRFLAVEATAADGQTVEIRPGVDANTMRRLRVMPDRALLDQVAAQVLWTEYVPSKVGRSRALERFRAQNPRARLAEPRLGAGVVYRPLTWRDAAPVPGQALQLERVKVQMWRLRFDPKRARVYSEPIGAPVVLQKEDGHVG